jgi:hypothetical protein
MAAIEMFLQFQDAVPCKIRAKRGCATHPRSIAERVRATSIVLAFQSLGCLFCAEQSVDLLLTQVRRTKISERIRKLQELVPNMDKVLRPCCNLYPIVSPHQIGNRTVQIRSARTTPENWLMYNLHFRFLQQTNTSDMLDLAVDYIKDLQKQVKVRTLLSTANSSGKWTHLPAA